MDRKTLDNWCEKGILALALFILVFGPLATGAVRTLEFLIIQTSTLGIVLLWLIRIWSNPRYHFFWPPICWAVLAFVGYAIIRYQFADVEYVARQELIRILVYAFLFFAVLNNLNRQESAQLIMLTLIGLAAVISIYAIYQISTNSPKVWHITKPAQYLNRAGGTYINPNHLAGFLEMILPLGLASILIGRFSHVTKIIIGYACLMILIGIGVSGSRGGWIATAIVLLVFFALLLTYRDFRIPAIALLVLVLIAGVLFARKVEQSRKRFEQTFQNGKAQDQRVEFWDSAIRMWKDHPWWGAGPGHYDIYFPHYRTEKVQRRPQYAHNDYLNTLADLGTVGVALIVLSLTLLTWGVFKTWPHVQRSANDLGTKKSSKAAFVLGGSLGLLAILVHSFFDFNMQIPANAILAIALMALISAYRRFASEQFWVTPGVLAKIFFTVIAGIGIVYLGHQGYRKAGEYGWLQRAKAAERNSDEELEALTKVAEMEPKNAEVASAIGEIFRLRSWEGNDDYYSWAERALPWFERGIKLNPHNTYNYIRYGMCLDWIKLHDKAAHYYERAIELDPNSYYPALHLGWHFIQVENYLEAKPRLERSLKLLDAYSNPTANTYLYLVNKKLTENPPTQN